MRAPYLLVLVGTNSIILGQNRTPFITPYTHNQRSTIITNCSYNNNNNNTNSNSNSSSNSNNDHYTVLGVSATASFADIKKAYRLLALKFHPDVQKNARSDDVFKSIRLAYDVLSNETSRNEYDRELKYQAGTGKPLQENWEFNHGFADEIKLYRWDDLRRRMRYERYKEKFKSKYENIPFYEETDEDSEEGTTVGEERGSFIKVIKSAFLSLFLLQTVGARLSLTFSTLTALLDQKLDSGYKVGYTIAWVLGGRGGVLLTLCLSFASWVCGKTSSSLVALVVVAMWVGSHIASYVPLPQGALLTLLYMSIKLQSDLN